ncbi:hypothetical protein [Micromonospora sp. NBC_01813]|uniref:hypothetical protein n=1 Tax=Micromonospora sp. NBC_01813 TaxID=2975988 RepID=UPI002DD896C0|nr:hypothetical protein [Micromonospora sp. NBC_01813]WSA08660.1 hypothetical protein OG958_31550 [Micromonospora sp. NBC_01813]
MDALLVDDEELLPSHRAADAIKRRRLPLFGLSQRDLRRTANPDAFRIEATDICRPAPQVVDMPTNRH